MRHLLPALALSLAGACLPAFPDFAAPAADLATIKEAPADPVAATKWHLISKARGETDLALDDFVSKLDPEKRAAGEAAAKKWLDALKGPPL